MNGQTACGVTHAGGDGAYVILAILCAGANRKKCIITITTTIVLIAIITTIITHIVVAFISISVPSSRPPSE